MAKCRREKQALTIEDDNELGENRKSFDEYEEKRNCSDAKECIREWMNSANYVELQMPSVMFNFWYDAIYDDDITFVRELLSSCNESEKRLLLNGRF